MFDQETLFEIEALALEMLSAHGFDPDSSPSMDLLCKRVTKSAPLYTRIVGRKGYITPFGEDWLLGVHKMLPPFVQRETIGHELGEYTVIKRGMVFETLAEREAWCDAFGACLVAPRPAFRRATRRIGHRVHVLARSFQTSQATAALRIGEVTGRSVLCLAKTRPIARGEPFAWPTTVEELRQVVQRPPRGVHPVRTDDLWTLMAG
jgi:hypothetical protein